MTAFGSAEIKTQFFTYRCEIRTLNSRFCDVSVKLPRSLLAFEAQIIQRIKERLLRGKVDVFIDTVPIDRTALLPQLNAAAVQHYTRLSDELQSHLRETPRALSVAELFRLEGVLESPLQGQDALASHEDGLKKVLERACEAVIKQRASEGHALGIALGKILDQISEQREIIDGKRQVIQAQVYETYRKRLDKLLQNLEDTGKKLNVLLPEERLLSEVALLTDRSDIEEEVTRLGAHIQEFQRLLAGGEEVGRRMDFLCQEMHREVNTISNKMTQLDLAQHSLLLKQGVERLRQQVQNIE